jgi:exoribonuclease R
MNSNEHHHHAILQNLAHRAMIERGLLPDFSPQVLAELDGMQAPAAATNGELVRDLTHRLWASIDNDDSRDLDQLTVAEVLIGNKVKLLVAIADVDALVKNGSAIDAHARHNTTSVYTAAQIFPMLPEKLSTDLTSLNVNVAAGERQSVWSNLIERKMMRTR